MVPGRKERGSVDVTVNVDVSKIVRNVAVAGVLIVGIIFGCSTYKKLLDWESCDVTATLTKNEKIGTIAFGSDFFSMKVIYLLVLIGLLRI